MIDFGQRLKEARQARGLTQSDLADAIAVNRDTILYYEQNSHLRQIEKLLKLCHALKVTPNILLGFEDKDLQKINNNKKGHKK